MTTAPSKRTVTDKLVDQALRRLAKRLEGEYEKCCPSKPASPDWFERLDRAELKLHELLEKRPLSKAEIVATTDRAYKALRQALQVEKQKQPRYREATNIETGAVRLIPDYGE